MDEDEFALLGAIGMSQHALTAAREVAVRTEAAMVEAGALRDRAVVSTAQLEAQIVWLRTRLRQRQAQQQDGGSGRTNAGPAPDERPAPRQSSQR